jgi:hypothetical protein
VNSASGSFSSVTGGQYNMANGLSSTVSGGTVNAEIDQFGWWGGFFHTP